MHCLIITNLLKNIEKDWCHPYTAWEFDAPMKPMHSLTIHLNYHKIMAPCQEWTWGKPPYNGSLTLLSQQLLQECSKVCLKAIKLSVSSSYKYIHFKPKLQGKEKKIKQAILVHSMHEHIDKSNLDLAPLLKNWSLKQIQEVFLLVFLCHPECCASVNHV